MHVRLQSIPREFSDSVSLPQPAISGYIADRVRSRKWPFLAGLAFLGGATALLCVGSHLALWIVGRLLQGASAAVVWTVGLAILVDTFGSDQLGKALGYAATTVAVGTTGGPLVGGALYEHGGYYAPFALAFGLIGIDFLLRFALIDRQQAAMQPQNVALEAEDAAPEIKDKTLTGEKSDSSPDSSGTKRPRYSDPNSSDIQSGRNHPILFLLRSPRLMGVLLSYMCMSVTMTSLETVLPLFVHDTFRWEQTAQGLILLPIMVPIFMAPIAGHVVDRWPKTRGYLAGGALLACVPPIVCLRFASENSMHDKVLLCGLLAAVGVCLGISEPPIMVEVACIVQEKEQIDPGIFGRGGGTAFAYGLANCAFALGSIVGPFLGGFARDGLGWNNMAWILSLPMGVSGATILLLAR